MSEDEIDAKLYHDYIEGNNNAFTKLVERHQESWKNVLYGNTYNEHEIEDVISDSIVKMLTTKTFDPKRGKFSTWSNTVVYRTFIDRKRSNKKRKTVDVTEYFEDVWTDEQDDPHYHAVKTENVNQLRHYLQKLNPSIRAAVQLVHLDHNSYKEAANICGCKIGTIKSRQNAGVNQLREMMD